VEWDYRLEVLEFGAFTGLPSFTFLLLFPALTSSFNSQLPFTLSLASKSNNDSISRGV
jgi:hypothetical protein